MPHPYARAVWLLLALSALPQVGHAAVPVGFQDSLVATVASPTALACARSRHEALRTLPRSHARCS
jgi:hypothetical protein